MICQKCGCEYPERMIHESHDVPCYLFTGNSRQEKKSKADKFPRHNICEDCHKAYEESLRIHMVSCAFKFATKYFRKLE